MRFIIALSIIAERFSLVRSFSCSIISCITTGQEVVQNQRFERRPDSLEDKLQHLSHGNKIEREAFCAGLYLMVLGEKTMFITRKGALPEFGSQS
ncbi:MAG: hypothetical protein JRI22_21910 [Deltaproteobacteria bacterium]|nr:hypothetical protein [Deltaproteobacteria bacterium]